MTSQQSEELIDGYLDGTLSEDEVAQLSAWIAADRANAEAVVLAAYLDRQLHDKMTAQLTLQDYAHASRAARKSVAPDHSKRVSPASRQPLGRKDSFFTASRFSAWRIAALFVFIASAVMTLTSPTWMSWWRSTPVATLADAVDAQWDAPQARLDVGDHLPYGPLFLKSGYASIRLDNGVKLVLVGPAHFSIDSLTLAHLDEGKLTADVPHTATGYSVKIPSGMITDLGTTFGVTAFANKECTVQVLKGSVQARLFSDDGNQKEQVVLTEDHAAALNPFAGTLASIPVERDTYVTDIRHIPVPVLPREEVALSLHNTGQRLYPGDTDPNWQILLNSDDPAWTPRAAIVATPLQPGWALGTDDSQWLSTAQDRPDMTVGCRLTFATTLDLTGVDPESVHLHLAILADNDIGEVRLNGQATPIQFVERHDYEHFHQFDLNHGFVAGKNKLQIVLVNGSYPAPREQVPNPMGLRVEFSGTVVRVDGPGASSGVQR
jgi:hypothetical protein